MTQKFTLSNRPSRMYLICRKLFEGFSKPLLPLSVPKVHGTRYYGSLILGRVLERISGLDHGVGHSLLLLYDAKAPRCQKSKKFTDLGHDPTNASISLF